MLVMGFVSMGVIIMLWTCVEVCWSWTSSWDVEFLLFCLRIYSLCNYIPFEVSSMC